MMDAKTILKRLFFIMIASVISVLLALGIIPLFEHVDTMPVKESASWMAKVDDHRLISDINLPGTHDSATQYVQLGFFSRCQDLSVLEQLEAGIRYLDIRLAIKDNQMKLMHSFTNAKEGPFPFSKTYMLDSLLKQCYSFLEKHPTETIVFVVRQEYGDESTAEFQELLNTYIKKHEQKWYLKESIPTLKQARGKIVFMRRYNDEAHLKEKSGLPLGWGEAQSDHDNEAMKVVAQSNFDSYQVQVQDLYENDREEKWKAFSLFLDYCESHKSDAIQIHFLSTKGSLTYGHPYYYAKQLNERFLKRKLLSHHKYGWIVMDFASPSLAKHIYETNYNEKGI